MTAARENGFVAVARDNVQEHMYVCEGIVPANWPRYGTINFSVNSPGDQTNRLGRVASAFFNPLRSYRIASVRPGLGDRTRIERAAVAREILQYG